MSPKGGMGGEKCELRAPLRPEDLCLVRRPLPRHCHESGNPGFLPGFLLAQEGHIAPAGLCRGGERRAGIEPASLTPSVPMGYVNRPTPGGTKSGAPGHENDVLKHLAEALAGLSPEERARLLAMLECKVGEA